MECSVLMAQRWNESLFTRASFHAVFDYSSLLRGSTVIDEHKKAKVCGQIQNQLTHLNLNSSFHIGECPSWVLVRQVLTSFSEIIQ